MDNHDYKTLAHIADHSLARIADSLGKIAEATGWVSDSPFFTPKPEPDDRMAILRAVRERVKGMEFETTEGDIAPGILDKDEVLAMLEELEEKA